MYVTSAGTTGFPVQATAVTTMANQQQQQSHHQQLQQQVQQQQQQQQAIANAQQQLHQLAYAAATHQLPGERHFHYYLYAYAD
ncbi:unnamed protein product [Protopolystoma xenopodis]|uniref:Uncharacterized protein n=1 Tax=Protopolystoma xenopodis TaxID=117903 RepID=A0A448XJQ3_9PLAT|nr:unnamed protein product [Protopolystoma xenopodis]